jgi:hypothetical protein
MTTAAGIGCGRFRHRRMIVRKAVTSRHGRPTRTWPARALIPAQARTCRGAHAVALGNAGSRGCRRSAFRPNSTSSTAPTSRPATSRATPRVG